MSLTYGVIHKWTTHTKHSNCTHATSQPLIKLPASGRATSGLATMAPRTPQPHSVLLPWDAALSPPATPSMQLLDGIAFHCSSRKCQLQELKWGGVFFLNMWESGGTGHLFSDVNKDPGSSYQLQPLSSWLLLLTLVRMVSTPPGIMITSIRKKKEGGTPANYVLVSIKIDKEML